MPSRFPRSNMSRALSSGNGGSSRSSSSAGASLYQPRPFPPTGVSLNRRSFRSLISAGGGPRLASPLLRDCVAAYDGRPGFAFRCYGWMRAPSKRRAFSRRCLSASKQDLGSRPTTSRMRGAGPGSTASPRPPSQPHPRPQSPSRILPRAHTQQDSSRSVATLVTTGRIRLPAKPSLRLTRRAIPSAAWLAMREGTMPSHAQERAVRPLRPRHPWRGVRIADRLHLGVLQPPPRSPVDGMAPTEKTNVFVKRMDTMTERGKREVPLAA